MLSFWSFLSLLFLLLPVLGLIFIFISAFLVEGKKKIVFAATGIVFLLPYLLFLIHGLAPGH